jgi:hypothetical protein
MFARGVPEWTLQSYTTMISRGLRGTLVLSIFLFMVFAALTADAQTLPSRPIVFADGQVTLGGDLSVAIGPHDPGFFNYTDYELSNIRLFRGDLTAAVKVSDRITILGALRSENGGTIRPHAIYVRVKPWNQRAIDIQAGRIPPTFGAFARRGYGMDNPLIGSPIAYQYLTTLRGDSLPATTDELLGMRGHGSLLRFSIGSQELEHGVAIASPSSWDTGVQVNAATAVLEATASVTAGTLSYPLWHDDNDRKRFAGRLAAHPVIGLVIGASASRGPFLTRTAARGAVGEGRDADFTQTAWGADLEYSRDHYVVRMETIVSGWTIPIAATPAVNAPLRATATTLEGRYRILPGVYGAVRLDRLAFSEITGTRGRTSWDAPVTRVEIGGGYSLQRNLLLKLSYQYNARDAGDVRSLGLFAGQLHFWF